MKRLLVVVDMQNDFISGALSSPEAEKIVPAVKDLVAREKQAGTKIVFTQDTHGENYFQTQEGKRLPVLHAVFATKGWEIVPPLREGAAHVFQKGAFGCLELAEFARDGGFEQIILCGVCTDVCVVSNALLIKAYCPEAEIAVVKNACAGTSRQNHEAALATMKSCQITVE